MASAPDLLSGPPTQWQGRSGSTRKPRPPLQPRAPNLRDYPQQPPALDAAPGTAEARLVTHVESFHALAKAQPRESPATLCAAFAAACWADPSCTANQEEAWRLAERVHGIYYSASVAARAAPAGKWRHAARRDAARLERLVRVASQHEYLGAAHDADEVSRLEEAAGVVFPLDARAVMLRLPWRSVFPLLEGDVQRAHASAALPFVWRQAVRLREGTDAQCVPIVRESLDPCAGVDAADVLARLEITLTQGTLLLDECDDGISFLHLVTTGPHRGELWRVTDWPVAAPVAFRWFLNRGRAVTDRGDGTYGGSLVASALCVAEGATRACLHARSRETERHRLSTARVSSRHATAAEVVSHVRVVLVWVVLALYHIAALSLGRCAAQPSWCCV